MTKLSVAGFTNLGYLIHSSRFEPIVTDLTDRTVVITGSTGGLGLETASSLARLGARVAIIGRDEEKIASAAEEVAVVAGTYCADLSSMAEVRQVATKLLDDLPRIDALINNVGTLFPERQVTAEGLEATLATNLAGQFLLTNLLIPELARSSPSRIINVSSGGMYTTRIQPDNLNSVVGDYSGAAAYARTKRGQVILTEMWAQRLEGHRVSVNSMHPGWVRTAGVANSLPVFNKVMWPFLRSTRQGADTIVWLASAAEPSVDSGKFWFDRRPVTTHLSNATQETEQERARLWEELVRLTGQEFPELSGGGDSTSGSEVGERSR